MSPATISGCRGNRSSRSRRALRRGSSCCPETQHQVRARRYGWPSHSFARLFVRAVSRRMQRAAKFYGGKGYAFLACQKATWPDADAATTLRQPVGPSRGSSSTEAPSPAASSVAAKMSATST